MSKIKTLDPVTISKIAAGEVIDRPVSIVKELIENSLDSGATSIRIDTEDGGKQSITVTDNGSGIDKDDLHLAVTQHATSKITSLEDIYDIFSFGFRGEALASIAHVAKVDIISNTSNAAYSIRAYEDQISTPEPTTHPKGTQITVSDLFFDIPVRRKFLKTPTTELSHITDMVIQFTLIHPEIDIILINNKQDIINTTGLTKQAELATHLYGKSLKGQLIPVDTEIGPLRFNGLISNPTHTFSNRSKQVVAVNQRIIKSGIIQKALSQSYRDLIPHNRHPLLLLSIEVNRADIDVNIHPQKHEIKFLNPGFLFDALPKAIRLALQAHQTSDYAQPAYTSLASQISTHIQRPINDTTAPSTMFSTSPYPETAKNIPFTATETLYRPPEETPLPLPESTDPGPIPYIHVFNTYIALTGPDGSLWILDQHAVHERILYEQFKQNYEKETPQHQALLVPEIIELSPSDTQQFEDHHSLLTELGFNIDRYGPQQIAIREIPIAFINCNVNNLVLNLLAQLKEIPETSIDLTLELKEKLQMKACQAAIKAGKHMGPEEVNALLKELIRCPSNYTCPHGRPLVLKFDQKKLESLFNRT